MSRASIVRNAKGEFYGIHIECPGCQVGGHTLPVDWCPPDLVQAPRGPAKPVWGFNGDLDRPTLTPSILSRFDWGPNRETRICHSFVRDGRIEFLSDCTHALAGQTVDLPEIVESVASDD